MLNNFKIAIAVFKLCEAYALLLAITLEINTDDKFCLSKKKVWK